MKNIKGCLSHNSDNWRTPKIIYDTYIKLGYFDPCPYSEDKPLFDGLSIEWKQYNFVNPPYSQLKKWIEKSICEAKKGKIIVLLIPARTDTKAFKLLDEYGHCFFNFITGRLHFNSSKNSAPFPSVIVVLESGIEHNYISFGSVKDYFTPLPF